MLKTGRRQEAEGRSSASIIRVLEIRALLNHVGRSAKGEGRRAKLTRNGVTAYRSMGVEH